jgi:hypothetical protein
MVVGQPAGGPGLKVPGLEAHILHYEVAIVIILAATVIMAVIESEVGPG